jgi:hypothetical protein
MAYELTDEWVTPEKAAEYLTHNHNNRPVNRRKLEELIRAMLADEFWGNTMLEFLDNGDLNNGQKRLMAQVATGKTIHYAVMRNVPMEAKNATDTGQTRSVAQILKFNGYKNANVITTVTALLSAVPWSLNGHERASASQLTSAVKKFPVIPEVVNSVAPFEWPVPCSVIATFALMVNPKNEANPALTRFLDDVKNCVAPSLGSPIAALLRRVKGGFDGRKSGNGRETQWGRLCAVGYAWEAYRDGKQIQRIQVNPGKMPACLTAYWQTAISA